MKVIQVLYWYENRYRAGIEVGDHIIDAHRGDWVATEEVVAMAPKKIKPVLRFKDWADLTQGEIVGHEDFWMAMARTYGEEQLEEIARKFDFSWEF